MFWLYLNSIISSVLLGVFIGEDFTLIVNKIAIVAVLFFVFRMLMYLAISKRSKLFCLILAVAFPLAPIILGSMVYQIIGGITIAIGILGLIFSPGEYWES